MQDSEVATLIWDKYSRMDQVKFVPLKILHGPFLNTLSHKKFLKMIYEIYCKVILEELNIFRNLN